MSLGVDFLGLLSMEAKAKFTANRPTWHTTTKGDKVLWRHVSKGREDLKSAIVLAVGRNNGHETVVRILFDETGKEKRVKIGELYWKEVKKK